MANKKISEFPVTTSLAGSDDFLINHLGTTSTVAFSSISDTISQTITNSLTGDTVVQKLSSNFIKNPATATNGQVLTYNGSTSTWVASAASFGIGSIVILQDQKPNNTNGGTINSTTWTKRVINTKTYDDSNLCTVNRDQFTLLSGTYLINASAPCYKVNNHKIRLRNITDNTTTCVGTTEYSSNGSTNEEMTSSHINNIFVITSSKTFELQHYAKTGVTDTGLGIASNSGELEVYTTIQLIKLK